MTAPFKSSNLDSDRGEDVDFWSNPYVVGITTGLVVSGIVYLVKLGAFAFHEVDRVAKTRKEPGIIIPDLFPKDAYGDRIDRKTVKRTTQLAGFSNLFYFFGVMLVVGLPVLAYGGWLSPKFPWVGFILLASGAFTTSLLLAWQVRHRIVTTPGLRRAVAMQYAWMGLIPPTEGSYKVELAHEREPQDRAEKP